MNRILFKQQSILLFVLFATALSFVSLPTSAYPLDYTTENIQFVLQDGQINLSKLNEFRDRLVQRRAEVQSNLLTNEEYLKGSDSDKIEKRLKNDKTLKIFDMTLGHIDELISKTNLSYLEGKEIEGKILELDLALRSDIDPVNTVQMLLKHVRTFSEQISISKTEAVLGEARNLYNPQARRLFTEPELQNFVRQGGDLSKLEPVPNNGVIESGYEIEKGSLQNRFLRGQNPLHKGLQVVYPKDNILYFDEIRKKQSRPKLTVFTKDASGKKQEYKLKLAMELHGEPTSAALSNAVGIFSDLTKYVKSVKVVLGKVSYEDFKLDWNSYYSSYDIDRLIKEKGRDQNGNFIVFVDGLLEPELDEDTLLRPGPWYWGAADHKYRREFRGLLLFNIWIHNTDLKEGENNKLVLRKKQDGTHDFYFVQQDLGFSFGHYFREKPNDFRWDIVEKADGKEVVFDYRNFQPNSGFEHVTWADARWMVRKIARLSRQQIEDAVAIGNWPNKAPYDYHSLLVEKLISRRNQMAQAFGLVGETQPDGRKIEIISFNREADQQAIPSSKTGVPDHTVDFSPELKSQVRDVVIEKIALGLKEGTISLIGAVNNVSVDPEWFGWDKGVISQVILNVNRTVVKNPNPKNALDAYLVRDDFKIGARLGAGLIVSGDVAYVRSFSLIYPALTYLEGLNGPRHIIDLLKHGYDEIESTLPQGHILINENYIEGRGRLEIDGGPISLGYEASISRIDLGRSLISRKKAKKLVFFEDESVYTEVAHKIFTRLGIFKIHHFKWSKQTGTVDRNIYELEFEKASLVDKAIFTNQFEQLKLKGVRQNLVSEFWHKQSKISLFGLWKRNKDLRRDLVDIWSFSGSDQKLDRVYSATKLVIEMSTEQNWQIFNNGEEHFKHIRFVGDLNSDRTTTLNPVMKLSFIHFDKNATNNELTDGYLPFINGLAGKTNFLNFTPVLHAFQGGWGELNLTTDLEIYQSGLQRLMNMTEEKFLATLMNQLGLIGRDLSFHAMANDEQMNSIDYYGKSYRFSDLHKASKDFIREWKKVVGAPSTVEKIEALTKALYVAGDRSGDSFQPLIYRVLLEQLQPEDYFMSAKIFVPDDIENKLPGKYNPYNQRGEQRKVSQDHDRLLFHMSQTWDIYQTF